jgi:antitoxin YefM
METFPLDTAKARLSELVDRVARDQDRIMVTQDGKPAAVLISPDELESLEETLAVMSDPRLVAQLREAEEELARGEGTPWEVVKAELEARRESPP